MIIILNIVAMIMSESECILISRCAEKNLAVHSRNCTMTLPTTQLFSGRFADIRLTSVLGLDLSFNDLLDYITSPDDVLYLVSILQANFVLVKNGYDPQSLPCRLYTVFLTFSTKQTRNY